MYLTASSSSGSKYYDLVARRQSYIANRWQEDVPTYSLIDVTETTMTINTYRTDNNSKIDDTVTIVKTADTTALGQKIDEIETAIGNGTLVEKDYTAESWAALSNAIETAKNVKAGVTSTQTEVDEALQALETAYQGLVKAPAQEQPKDDGKQDNSQTDEKQDKVTTVDKKDDPSTGHKQLTDDHDTVPTAAKVSKVKTGDEAQTALWTIVCIAGIAACGAGIFFYKRMEKKREQ